MTLVLGDGNVCGTTPIMCLGHVRRGRQRPCPKLAPDDDLALTITPCSRGGHHQWGKLPGELPVHREEHTARFPGESVSRARVGAGRATERDSVSERKRNREQAGKR